MKNMYTYERSLSLPGSWHIILKEKKKEKLLTHQLYMSTEVPLAFKHVKQINGP